MTARHGFSAGSTVFALATFPQVISAASQSTYISYSRNATDVMNQVWYDHSTGLWQNLWWNSANLLTSIGNLAEVDSSFKSTAENIFQTTFTGAKAANGGTWLNNFYDDEGWWAMAWIKAYDVTGNQDYLSTAKNIFQDLVGGLGATCGGHWWSKDKKDNTAIGNQLYLQVAAALANRVPSQRAYYQKYAQDEVNWLLSSGMINGNNTFNDGLDISTCKPEGWVFTYNQGVILGALVEMNALTGDSNYLDTAKSIAYGAMDHLSNNGILTEPEYPDTDVTGAQFKGVFARNLADLYAAQPDDTYVNFLQNNADSIWANARGSNGQIGADWQGPVKDIFASSQGSALDCLVAAAAVTDDVFNVFQY
ncbi:glycoside hydrolase family 76 protein [Acrodontium crateriforme]|uniref:Glycoside hydrolase family 76 protein n=1 Tax=Acrodontium crateriforme TaxID=150365 RepID=A0AAQ3RB84_9PEZI|nr:glycoside hydrolase family 76 protein [Acrodontium crateriforme]